MRSTCKAIGAVLLAFALLLMPISGYAAMPKEPTDAYFVNDYSDVIDDSVEQTLAQQGEALALSGGPEIVLVTVDFTDGETMEDYALELFNTWKIGSAERNDGLLVLMAIGEKDYYVLPGEGMLDTMSEGTLLTVLEANMLGDFDAGNYTQAAQNTYNALVQKCSAGTNANNTNEYGNYGNYGTYDYGYGQNAPYGYNNGGGFFFVGGFFVLLLVILVLISLLRGIPRRRWYRSYYGVPFYPFAPRFLRRYGPGGFWGSYGGPRPGFHSQPPPPGFGPGFGGGFRGSRPGNPSGFGGGAGRPPSGRSGFGGSGFGSGSSRGGGVGRSSSGRSGFGGGSRGGFGGGSSRGGGVGRR